MLKMFMGVKTTAIIIKKSPSSFYTTMFVDLTLLSFGSLKG